MLRSTEEHSIEASEQRSTAAAEGATGWQQTSASLGMQQLPQSLLPSSSDSRYERLLTSLPQDVRVCLECGRSNLGRSNGAERLFVKLPGDEQSREYVCANDQCSILCPITVCNQRTARSFVEEHGMCKKCESIVAEWRVRASRHRDRIREKYMTETHIDHLKAMMSSSTVGPFFQWLQTDCEEMSRLIESENLAALARSK